MLLHPFLCVSFDEGWDGLRQGECPDVCMQRLPILVRGRCEGTQGWELMNRGGVDSLILMRV